MSYIKKDVITFNGVKLTFQIPCELILSQEKMFTLWPMPRP